MNQYRKQHRVTATVTLEDGTVTTAIVVVPAYEGNNEDIMMMTSEALRGEELEVGKVAEVNAVRYAQLAG
jgi:hypothetical protein